ncbi:MAG: hypothetical protein HOQ24_08630 [Mycobacteriaceae bacterium]|nr:hypothetical protein [Mycobacteriaceae bacterium]
MSWGSFQVRYVDDLDKVCVKVRRFAELGGMSMQLTLNQAELLRELLDAGIADMRAAKQVLELPAGGAA